jgi:hypothetical protein
VDAVKPRRDESCAGLCETSLQVFYVVENHIGEEAHKLKSWENVPMRKKSIYSLTLSILLSINISGCSTSTNYTPPLEIRESATVILRDPFETAWSKSVRALGGSFFVMNNIVKDSKIINLSYSGDPEKYVDCGHVAIDVKEGIGTTTYQFPAARRSVQFKLARGFSTSVVDRQMSLEGRINILFEELDKNETVVKVVVRYMVTRTGTETVTDYIKKRISTLPLPPLTFSFNTGGTDSGAGETNLTCRATGEMEKALIDLLASSYTQ